MDEPIDWQLRSGPGAVLGGRPESDRDGACPSTSSTCWRAVSPPDDFEQFRRTILELDVRRCSEDIGEALIAVLLRTQFAIFAYVALFR
jgi:hypothetical protein